jgi:hypothetical protein
MLGLKTYNEDAKMDEDQENIGQEDEKDDSKKMYHLDRNDDRLSWV